VAQGKNHMATIVVVYHSGNGYTAKQAQAVATGANAILMAISSEGNLNDAEWATLDASDAIIMGSPTYMGMVTWQFKKFADATSKQWMTQKWKDKIAAGFTNSASMNGDKLSTLHYIFTLAMQHSMIWTGTGLMPAGSKDMEDNDWNYVGSFSGAMATSSLDGAPDEMIQPGLETAKQFGARVAEVTARWVASRD
jgi:NAD(P)H dehydrogenase (quinone)